MRPWVWLVLAIALIFLGVLPWGDFQGHTHWAKVGWIPFVSPPVRTRDIVINLLLFAPFGAAVARMVRSPAAVPTALIGAAILSFLAETAQLYSHTRFPSATDLVCNAAGAALTAAVMSRRLTGRSLERRPADDEDRSADESLRMGRLF